MGRHKTISDDDVLAAARSVFRRQGHAASTREIARVAGISEAVLYQRFGSKDALFFAAMAPGPLDLARVLGAEDEVEDAHAFLREVVERMAGYFGEILPLALQMMIHPSFDHATLANSESVSAAARLEAELARRLQALVRRQLLSPTSPVAAARLLTSLAHDWALSNMLAPGDVQIRRRDLATMVNVAWSGLAPGEVVTRRSASPRTAGARVLRKTR